MTLVFDTATSACTVAVGEGQKLLAEKTVIAPREHMEKLLPQINEVLKAAGTEINQVNQVYVGLGPGSFTGIRIALSIGIGLTEALNIPLRGISTLDVLAYGSKNPEGTVIPVIDAKRGEVYFATYEKADGEFKQIMPYQALKPEEFLGKINQIDKEMSILGDALYVYKDLIEKGLPDRCRMEAEENWYPQASNLLHLASINKEQESEEVKPVTPLYIRRPIAEENFPTKREGRK